MSKISLTPARIDRGVEAFMKTVAAKADTNKTGRIYGQEGAERYTALVGTARPEPSQIQSALKRLSRLGLADKVEGEWRLTDPIFEAWVRNRPASDF